MDMPIKEKNIKDFILGLGVNDTGFAAADNYNSPRSPELKGIFPSVKSIIVLAFKEMSSCESDNLIMAMSGRQSIKEFSSFCTYRTANYLETVYGAKVMPFIAYAPMDLTQSKLGIGEISLRHAALAAGLGLFGRHNLIIHPEMGTRVVFTAILTDIELAQSPLPENNPCTECNLCVDGCPGRALDEKGKTDVRECIKVSQPYGMMTNISFWQQFAGSNEEEQKAMLNSEHYWRIFQSMEIGTQYKCFNCMKNCPIGR